METTRKPTKTIEIPLWSYDDAREGIEPDIYTSDLTAWLASNNVRLNWLTEAIQNNGPDIDGEKALAIAQHMEREDVLARVWSELEDVLVRKAYDSRRGFKSSPVTK